MKEKNKLWLRVVVVNATAQRHSTKPKLKFYSGSNPARRVSEICDDENPGHWSRVQMKLITFRWSTVLQKQLIHNYYAPNKTFFEDIIF